MEAAADYVYKISDGNAGIHETLYLMRSLVNRAQKDRDFIQFARDLTRDIPEKDLRRRMLTIFHFVRDRVRYTLDPDGLELITSPQQMIELREGDCDDKASFLAALLKAIGVQTRFRAVGFDGAELSHVYVEAKYGDRWIALDSTERFPAGWEPDAIKNSFRVNN